MSYLVLARKYRPRNFTEMVGQDHVVQADIRPRHLGQIAAGAQPHGHLELVRFVDQSADEAAETTGSADNGDLRRHAHNLPASDLRVIS